MGCADCGGTGFRIIERGDYSAAAICECRTQKASKVTITEQAALVAAHMICDTLAFAPHKDSQGRTVIAEALVSMCSTDEQAIWVAKRICDVYRKWEDCGIPGIRQALCSKYPPRDGIEIACTDKFPDGFPPERPQIEVPPMKALAAGEPMSAEPMSEEFAEKFNELTAKTKMPVSPARSASSTRPNAAKHHRC